MQKMSFAILGEYNMFDNKFDQYRTKVCSEITALCPVYFIGPGNLGPRK